MTEQTGRKRGVWTVALSFGAIVGMSLGVALDAVVGAAGAAVGLGAGLAVTAGFWRYAVLARSADGRPFL